MRLSKPWPRQCAFSSRVPSATSFENSLQRTGRHERAGGLRRSLARGLRARNAKAWPSETQGQARRSALRRWKGDSRGACTFRAEPEQLVVHHVVLGRLKRFNVQKGVREPTTEPRVSSSSSDTYAVADRSARSDSVAASLNKYHVAHSLCTENICQASRERSGFLATDSRDTRCLATTSRACSSYTRQRMRKALERSTQGNDEPQRTVRRLLP